MLAAQVMLVTLALSLVSVGSSQSGSNCTDLENATTGCSVAGGIDDGSAVLEGTETAPGSPGGSTGAANSGGTGAGTSAPDACPVIVQGKCYGTVPKPGDAAPPAQPITLRDIASFRPAPGVQHMEPNGWVVAGLDANFYAVVNQQLVAGTLLGQPATVRFTPTGYHWNYGDGTAATRSTKGATWASQGLHDFDPSPTSHVYAAEGDFVIRLSIDFRAEYRFGSAGFVPIVGTITLPANELRVTVTGAKTVLVEHDCNANPGGPGC